MRKSVIEDLKKEQITVIGLSASLRGRPSQFNSAPQTSFGCGGAYPAGPRQTEDITDATGGTLRLSDNTAILGDIVDSLDALTFPFSFSVDMSDCEGLLNSKYDPSFPLTLGPGEEVLVTQTISVDQKLCEERKTSFMCTFQYIQSGVFSPPTNVRTTKIIGCPDSRS